VALAALIAAALVAQFLDVLSRDVSVVSFLSFFTIQSNVFGMVVLAWLGLRHPPPAHRIDQVRGAAVVYLTITGVVYALLLSDDPAAVETTLPWVNTVLHQVAPVLIVVDWLVDPPSARIAGREAAWWFAYPIVWIAYTMVRGAIVDWYPYPFLDPRREGWASVVTTSVAITVGFGIVIALVAWIGNVRTRRVAAPT